MPAIPVWFYALAVALGGGAYLLGHSQGKVAVGGPAATIPYAAPGYPTVMDYGANSSGDTSSMGYTGSPIISPGVPGPPQPPTTLGGGVNTYYVGSAGVTGGVGPPRPPGRISPPHTIPGGTPGPV